MFVDDFMQSVEVNKELLVIDINEWLYVMVCFW